MYFLPKFCCICLNNNVKLKHVNNNNSEILQKLNYCVPEIVMNENTVNMSICCKCCEQLEIAYSFKEMCLRNHVVIEGYVSQLQNVSTDKEAELSIRLLKSRTEVLSVEPEIFMETTSNIAQLFLQQSENYNRNFPPTSKDPESLILLKEEPTSLDNEPNIFIKVEAENENTRTGNSRTFLQFNNTRSDSVHVIQKCFSCNKIFNSESELSIHMKICSCKRPHKCDICQKSFAYPSMLKSHYKAHTKEKNFECYICNKKFSKQSNVNNHMLIHKGIRRHKCELCERSFTIRGDLNRHMLTHTKERNFACPVCNKKFAQKPSLNRHFKVMHDRNFVSS